MARRGAGLRGVEGGLGRGKPEQLQVLPSGSYSWERGSDCDQMPSLPPRSLGHAEGSPVRWGWPGSLLGPGMRGVGASAKGVRAEQESVRRRGRRKIDKEEEGREERTQKEHEAERRERTHEDVPLQINKTPLNKAGEMLGATLTELATHLCQLVTVRPYTNR